MYSSAMALELWFPMLEASGDDGREGCASVKAGLFRVGATSAASSSVSPVDVNPAGFTGC